MRTRPRFGVVIAMAVVAVLASSARAAAQQFELLNSFAGCPAEGCGPGVGDAARPYSLRPLVLAPDGNLYGTSVIDWPSGAAGPRNNGTVYRVGPDGTRVIVHQFVGIGPGTCGTGGLTVGPDGAVYGLGEACGGTPAVIYRISGGVFQIVFEFPDSVHPIFLEAGSNGAFYGSAVFPQPSPPFLRSFKWDGALTLLNTYAPNLQLAPDGHFYFARASGFGFPDDVYAGQVSRLTASDQFQTIHDFTRTGTNRPENTLLVGENGLLYGTTRDSATFGPPRLYRMTLGGVITYLPDVPGLRQPLGIGRDGSIYVSIDAGSHGAISRVAPDGTVVPVHVFDGTDGSGEFSLLTRGADGHLYGVLPKGGAHGLGVLYRLRMPSVDLKANGADGPVTVGAGEPLSISMAFDASATGVVDPSEVYLAVVTPALEVLWLTASGVSLTPTPLSSGPLSSFPPTPLINIPDAAVLPPGDYYWVAIVDADANGVPNGHYVDFVKTTKAGTALATRRQ